MHNAGAGSEQRPWLWRPGQSGNPAGRRSRKVRYDKLMGELACDMGGLDALSGGDRIMLGRAVDLLLSRPTTDVDRVRATNAAARLVKDIRGRYLGRLAAKPQVAPLHVLLRRERERQP
jgi:hypothetical protein